MAFTVQNLADLERAIAEGANKVKYQDREVELRTQNQLLALRELMRRDLGQATRGPRRTTVATDQGLK